MNLFDWLWGISLPDCHRDNHWCDRDNDGYDDRNHDRYNDNRYYRDGDR